MFPNILILHPYSSARFKEQKATWKALKKIREKLVVKDWLLVADVDYDAFVASFWKQGNDLVIIEQDIVPSIALVRELLDCPGDWCIHSYINDLPKDTPVPTVLLNGKQIEVNPGGKQLITTGLGFTK